MLLLPHTAPPSFSGFFICMCPFFYWQITYFWCSSSTSWKKILILDCLRLLFFWSWTFSRKWKKLAIDLFCMRLARNKEILLRSVNNTVCLEVDNTHGTVSSRHHVGTLRILFIEGTRPISITWKHPQSKDSRYTYPAFPSKNREEALRQPPVRAKPPPIYTTPPQREIALLFFVFLFARDHADQSMWQPSGNKQSSSSTHATIEVSFFDWNVFWWNDGAP